MRRGDREASRRAGRAVHVECAGGPRRSRRKPAAKLRKRFAKLKRAKLTVRVTVTDAAGAKQVLTKRV